MDKLIQIWKKEYPEPETFRDELKTMLATGFIVAFILFAFQPFGLHTYPGSKLYLATCFGLVTFFTGLLVYFIFTLLYRYVIKKSKHTFGHWIVESIGMILAIAVGNLLLLDWVFNQTWTSNAFFMMILNTFLIGLFPLTIFGLIYQNKAERKNAKSAKDLNDDLSENSAAAQNNQILAVESMQNYVHIYLLNAGEFVKRTERRTLASVLAELGPKGLIKCHRSFLVNPIAIEEVSGNAQGLKLKLTNSDCPIIPVSRSYIPKVKDKLLK